MSKQHHVQFGETPLEYPVMDWPVLNATPEDDGLRASDHAHSNAGFSITFTVTVTEG